MAAGLGVGTAVTSEVGEGGDHIPRWTGTASHHGTELHPARETCGLEVGVGESRKQGISL